MSKMGEKRSMTIIITEKHKTVLSFIQLVRIFKTHTTVVYNPKRMGTGFFKILSRSIRRYDVKNIVIDVTYNKSENMAEDVAAFLRREKHRLVNTDCLYLIRKSKYNIKNNVFYKVEGVK